VKQFEEKAVELREKAPEAVETLQDGLLRA